MSPRSPVFFVFPLLALGAGCGDSSPSTDTGDSGPPVVDAGRLTDAGRPDAGRPDAGAEDAGARPPRPDLNYEAGTCEALRSPADLSTDTARGEAREMIERLDPIRVFEALSWLSAHMDGCAQARSGLATQRTLEAGEEGCRADDGSIFWGRLDSYSSLRRRELTAEAFSARLPPGSRAALVQLDGRATHTTSGYGVGNPPFHGSVALYVRVEGSPEGLPDGAWLVEVQKPLYGDPARGYLHHLEGETWPLGDFCFEATYEGRHLRDVTFDEP